MIKDVFVLRKNSWHMKLMKFIWKYNHYDFPNMCPYFWLSVLNVLIAIVGVVPYIVYKAILVNVYLYSMDFFNYLDERIEKYCDKKADTWLEGVLRKMEQGDSRYFEKLATNYKFSRKLQSKDPDVYNVLNYGSDYYAKYMIMLSI